MDGVEGAGAPVADEGLPSVSSLDDALPGEAGAEQGSAVHDPQRAVALLSQTGGAGLGPLS